MENSKAFEDYLFDQGIAEGTIAKHISSLKGISLIAGDLKKETLEQYFRDLLRKGRTPDHINNLTAAARHYGRFIGKEDEYKQLKYRKVKPTTKGILSDEEIIAFLSITSEQMADFLRAQNTLHGNNRKVWIDKPLYDLFTFFFSCLANTGMRPNELVKLRVTQVDFGRGVIQLDQKTKTGESRTIAMTEHLKPLLQEYIRKLDSNRLFPDLGRHQWKHQFNNRIAYLGIKREHITTYSLRHSWITSLLDNEANLIVVSDMAGHKDINRTKDYYKMTVKSKVIAIKKLSLVKQSLPYYERSKQFNEGTLRLLQDLALSSEERKQMLHDFINFV